jgi:alginate O-acetyltransferase complex protein AlgI
MLFTTVPFLLMFLPLVLAGFFLLGRWRPSLAALWLLLASLFFYGFWMPEFVLLLLGSIAMNFAIGMRIAHAEDATRARRAWLVLGVTLNLALLGYFKYANFFVANVNAVFGAEWKPAQVILPIGISFYSFTQIAFLVDTYRNKVREFNAVHYGLFVTYFPHLIAGPVLHHAQMMPQFALAQTYRVDGGNLAAGLAIFCLGLFKKVVLADGIAPYADAVFNPADQGLVPSTPEAWLAATAYMMQLYFDFSGYSDMAIGLSWMFNVRLPINFDSPYRARSISDFWRRWHISLSTFLRDYLYFALGGNRHGALRRYGNLMTTMLLGGLWHGASWSFVIWGALHGAYLMVNHGFRALCGERLCERLDRSRSFGLFAWLLTMLAVLVAWVLFRAQSLQGAVAILGAMLAGPAAADNTLLWNAGLQLGTGLSWCVALAAMAFLAPNSNRIGEWLLQRVHRGDTLRWVVGSLAMCTVLFLLLVNTARDSVSAFIYFNF